MTTIQERTFFREFGNCMNVDRPSVVLNCSKVRQVGRLAIHLLLCCLEEAIKHDGDVKLAAVTPSARETLRLSGVDRLFEIYDTETDAVSSFLQSRCAQASDVRGSLSADQISESAKLTVANREF